jgi:hypothetical protein
MNIFIFITFIEVSCLVFVNGCSDGPLGMSNGDIKDWQITASSTLPSLWDKDCHAKYSRLYEDNGRAWCAKHRSDSEWLQIDLGVTAKTTGVIIQGRAGRKEWVTAFMISYSTDAFQWQYITDKYGNQKVFKDYLNIQLNHNFITFSLFLKKKIFQGNLNDNTIKHNYFDETINARFIKFHTVQWHRHPSLRVEILGCQECKVQLGLPPYGHMKASSYAYRNRKSCKPSDGSLLNNKGWCARRGKSIII